VAHGGEARLDHVRAADVDRNHLRVMTIAGAVERQFLAAQWSPRMSAFVERDRQLRVELGRSRTFSVRPISGRIAKFAESGRSMKERPTPQGIGRLRRGGCVTLRSY
jgi:hypothetical protein